MSTNTGAQAPTIPEDQLTGCSCRWHGETLVRMCGLHQGWRDAIGEWAERAREAEALLQTRAAISKIKEQR